MTWTPERIAESRKICNAASPEWAYWDNRGEPFWDIFLPKRDGHPPAGTLEGIGNQGVRIGSSNGVIQPADCKFAVHARTALPAALDEIERLRAIVEGVHFPEDKPYPYQERKESP